MKRDNIIIGSRGSKLAVIYAEKVKSKLSKFYSGKIEIKKIIPNDKLSIHKGGIEPLGSFENNWIFKQISLLLQHHNYELKTPINKLSKECLNQVLYGTDQLVKILGENGIHQVLNGFEGVGNFILRHHKEGGNKLKRWASKFLNKSLISFLL